MTTEPAPVNPVFTEPDPLITEARTAITRLQLHFDDAAGPIDESTDATSLTLAVLSLESIHPPYPPLRPDITASTDPRADLDAAIAALLQLSVEAATARETLRFAYVIRDLREVEHSPYLAIRPGTSARH